jgi:nitroreductase
MNETLKTIKQRRSVRTYLDKQVSDDELKTIIEAGLYAPNSGGNIEENICFTVIQNRNILNKINVLAKEAAGQTDMDHLKRLGNDETFNCLYNAPVLIIVSYREKTMCPEIDCSAATENMLLAAESAGLGGCWLYFPLMAFQSSCGKELLKELKIADGFKPYTSMAIGRKGSGVINVPERKARHIFYIK